MNPLCVSRCRARNKIRSNEVNVKREPLTQIVLVIVGLLNLPQIYFLYMDLRHSSWLLERKNEIEPRGHELVDCIQPCLLIRGAFGITALDRRVFQRRCQPQLLVPTRRFHEVNGARRRSVPKLRKLSVGLSANHDPM